MAAINSFSIDRETLPGHVLLRYTAVIVNEGTGPFELSGQRPDTSTPEMSVTQRIYGDGGGHRDVETPATMYFAGDGHNHWHVKDLESSELTHRGKKEVLGTQAKHGFCFSDNTLWVNLPGAPSSAFYRDCGFDPTVLRQTMGLSVGWADIYSRTTNQQWIDITGLPIGNYRLTDTADAGNQFVEADDSNNFTWTDLRIYRNRLRVLAVGPHG